MTAMICTSQPFGFAHSEQFLSPSPGPRDWLTIIFGEMLSRYRVISGELTL